MEFKDRVSNKPNRIKITYEDGRASVFATVEMADEPLEEGTPLNAKNMNKLLNKENNDYIFEQGIKEVVQDGENTPDLTNGHFEGTQLNKTRKTKWYYEKMSSGTIKLWGFEQRTIKIDTEATDRPNTEVTYNNGGIWRIASNKFILPTNLGITDISCFIPQVNGETRGAWGGQGFYSLDKNNNLCVYSDVFTPFYSSDTDGTNKNSSNQKARFLYRNMKFNLIVIGKWK